MKRIILTGGHAATTAAAVVQEIIVEKKGWKIFFIGAKNAIEGKKISTLESQILPKLGVEYLPITTGRLQRKFTIWTIPSILKIPLGFIQAVYYMVKVRPNLVLSFGGYSAFPVVAISRIFGIPVILHEQTSAAGRANLFAAPWATKIALSRNTSLDFFPQDKSVVTGNPVMKEMIKVGAKKEPGSPPAIYITGGSRGSQSINDVVEKVILDLVPKYKIYHQTGELNYKKFERIKGKLHRILNINYMVFSRVSPEEVAEIYKKVDVVVSRAGANTVSEIITTKRPAILIPLPISYKDEQTKNAEFASNFGVAKIILQDQLTPKVLLEAIDETFSNYGSISKEIAKKGNPDASAAKKLVEILSIYLS